MEVARVNVYLSDDLHEEVKSAEIEISAVCQTALREAVTDRRRSKRDQLDVLGAVQRIALTAREGPLRNAEGRKAGRRWAMHTATLQDLKALDELEVTGGFAYWGSGVERDGSSALEFKDFESLRDWLVAENLDDTHEFDSEDWVVDDYTEGFVAAAKEFWAEAKPLLDESEATRERRAAALRQELRANDEAPF